MDFRHLARQASKHLRPEPRLLPAPAAGTMRVTFTIVADFPVGTTRAELEEIMAAAFCQVDDNRVDFDTNIPTTMVNDTITVAP